MSEPVTALGGASVTGIAAVAEAPVTGMITLRGDPSAAKFKKAVKAATGCAVPGQRSIATKGAVSLAWMSPDELLIVLPKGEVAAMLASLTDGLAGQHHLAADVSDARAVYTVSGPAAREVLAKLAPVDLAPGQFEAGELRRTRLAQVPAAFWLSGEDTFTVVCFRSVAQYVFDLLAGAAKDGSGVGHLTPDV